MIAKIKKRISRFFFGDEYYPNLIRKIRWHSKEAIAYCFDYAEQFRNWMNGTFCLYFNEGFYVDRFGPETTGIDKINIWIGPNTRQSYKRIFVGNDPYPSSKNATNLFMIKIPEFEIKGKVNRSLITDEKLEQIKKWIIENQDAVLDYCDFNTYDTLSFIRKIKPL